MLQETDQLGYVDLIIYMIQELSTSEIRKIKLTNMQGPQEANHNAELVKVMSVNVWDYPSLIPTNPDQEDQNNLHLRIFIKIHTDVFFTISSYDVDGCSCWGTFHKLRTVMNKISEALEEERLGGCSAGRMLQLDSEGLDIFVDFALMEGRQVDIKMGIIEILRSKMRGVVGNNFFRGKATPLFASMLVQSTEDEGATSERPSEPQPTPSPPHLSEANIKPQFDPSPRPSPTPHISDSIPEVSGGNHGSKDWQEKKSLMSKLDAKRSLYSIKGRKSTKAEPSVHKDPLFDELNDDEIDNMDTEDAQDVGRTRNKVNAEKEATEDAVSTEDVVSTDKEKTRDKRLDLCEEEATKDCPFSDDMMTSFQARH
ncbi:hypothetical protein Tco_0817543 [Tanacetum coccineum]